MNATAQPETTPAAEARRLDYQLPAVNLFETAERYVIEADMPGVNKDGLEVYLDRHELTLVGRRNGVARGQARYRESALADYRRTFELAPEIDTEHISARIDNGVLVVTLPKAERVRPRKIAVNA